MRGKTIVFCIRLALLTGLAGSLAGCARTTPADELPPVVYMCPMVKDAAVLEHSPGKCPECGMELKPVRIVTAYSCLNNTAFIQETPGKCIVNGTDLVPITASMFFVCKASPDQHELDPGKCPDGSDRVRKYEPRLHGDHNPRHGGQFFMADDGWHHLEGTYPGSGLFRVFFYDDWTRPLEPGGFTVRAIVKDSSGKEVAAVPLKASGAIENAMEAEIPKSAGPLNVTLRVRFKPGDEEKYFDFMFPAFSVDPNDKTPVTRVAEPEPPAPKPDPAPAPAPGAAAKPPEDKTPTAAVAANSAVPAPPVEAPPSPPKPEDTRTTVIGMDLTAPVPRQAPIPATAVEILRELAAQSDELNKRITGGAPLGEMWVPALRTKDLGLALVADHLKEIPASQQALARNAADRLVRSAFAIDNFGDLGDRDKIVAAHDVFKSAVKDLKSAYASIR